MPNSLQTLDTSFPKVDSHQTAEENLNKVTNYLYMLLENLKYTLGNLGEDNFNQTELDSIAKMITEPVWASIADQDGNLNELNVTAKNLLSRITSAEGGISTLNQTAQTIQSTVQGVQGDVSTLTQTATSLESRITGAEGGISTLSQTVNGLSLSVTNGEDSSTIRLMSGATQISSKTIQMSGMVTFGDLSYAGSTTINGSNITTGSINASLITTGTMAVDRVKLFQDMAVYTGKSSSTIGGYVGYTPSANDGSAGIHMASGRGEVVATNNGAKLLYFDNGSLIENQIYIANNSAGIRVMNSWYYLFEGSFYSNSSSSTLGTSARLWGQIYSTNSVISTSDRNRKHDIQVLPGKYVDMFDRLVPVRFKLDDGTSDRYHVGLIAQDVEEAMQEAGITGREFGGFVKDMDDETDEELYFLRYEEFIGVVIAKIKELEGRINEGD